MATKGRQHLDGCVQRQTGNRQQLSVKTGRPNVSGGGRFNALLTDFSLILGKPCNVG